MILFTVLCAAFVSVGAEVLSLSTENPPNTLLKKFPYSVILFYGEETKHALQLFELTSTEFEKIHSIYSPEVGWASVNVDQFPQLALKNVEQLPTAMSVGAGHLKTLNFDFTVPES